MATLDLQVVNPTEATFGLAVHLTDTHLVGAWTADHPLDLRYEVYEATHVIEPVGPAAPGAFVRRNVPRRRTLDPDRVQVTDELVAANHALMRDRPLLEGR